MNSECECTSPRRRVVSRSQLNFVIDLLTLLLMLALVVTGLLLRYVLPPGTGGRHGGPGLVLWGIGRHDWGAVHFWMAASLVGLLLVHVALHWSWACGIVRRWAHRGGERLSGRALALSGVVFLALLTALIGGFCWLSGARVERTSGRAVEAHTTLASTGPGAPATGTNGLDTPDAPVVGADAPVVGADVDRPAHRGRLGLWRGHRQGRRGGSRRERTVRGHMSLREVANRECVPIDRLKAGLGLPASVGGDERLGRLGRRYGFRVDGVRRIVASHQRRSPAVCKPSTP